MQPKIIAHGGAWYWDDNLDQIKKQGMLHAMKIGYDILRNGGTAADAVVATVVELENNPVFDAGTGGYIDQAGQVSLDALFCDGSSIDFGALACVSKIKNPIVLARKILEETDHSFFVGEGADQLGKELGIDWVSNDLLITTEMKQFHSENANGFDHDTVGALAIDAHGQIVVGTSTSGSPFKPRGRVGDSPLFGSGGYADNRIGGAGATGLGENIMRLLISKKCCDLIEQGLTAQEAASRTIQYADNRISNSMTGVMTIDHLGRIGVAHSTPKMALGWVDDRGEIKVAINAREGFPT